MLNTVTILTGSMVTAREVPAGGFQTRPATRGEKVLLGLLLVIVTVGPAIGLGLRFFG